MLQHTETICVLDLGQQFVEEPNMGVMVRGAYTFVHIVYLDGGEAYSKTTGLEFLTKSSETKVRKFWKEQREPRVLQIT